jgi:hypothetical protein
MWSIHHTVAELFAFEAPEVVRSWQNAPPAADSSHNRNDMDTIRTTNYLFKEQNYTRFTERDGSPRGLSSRRFSKSQAWYCLTYRRRQNLPTSHSVSSSFSTFFLRLLFLLHFLLLLLLSSFSFYFSSVSVSLSSSFCFAIPPPRLYWSRTALRG